MNKRQKKKFIKKGSHKKFWKRYEIMFLTDENDMIHCTIRKSRILKAYRYVNVQLVSCDSNMPSPKEEKEIDLEFTSGNYSEYNRKVLEKVKDEIAEASKNLTYDFSNIKESLDYELLKYKKDTPSGIFPNTSEDNRQIDVNMECNEIEESTVVSYVRTWLNGLK